jgi:hypothetical protein
VRGRGFIQREKERKRKRERERERLEGETTLVRSRRVLKGAVRTCALANARS